MTDLYSGFMRHGLVVLAACFGLTSVQAQALHNAGQMNRTGAGTASGAPAGDYIVALVNSEPITNVDVRQRLLRVEQQLALRGVALPPRDELLPDIVEQLVVERAQMQQAAEMGLRVDSATLLQAEQAIAAENQLDLEGFRRRAVTEGADLNRIRNELRDQILLQRLREREIDSRVRVSEADIDAFLLDYRGARTDAQEVNLGHVLIQVPEGSSPEKVAELQRRAQTVVDQLNGGADFAAVARSFSEAPEAATGGQFGWRPLNRLPSLFVSATRMLPVGGIAGPFRSPVGFHVLKVFDRRQNKEAEMSVAQSRSRHILLRTGQQLSLEEALTRLKQFREQIIGGQASFPGLARRHSQDGSASEGGDLGWVNPGQFVPEFEAAMNALNPGDVSQPVVTRYGVHLIRLEERRQVPLSEREQREMARGLLREKKAEEALKTWAEEVRGRAFVEQREAPRP
jgi:peptidyl-prolyl cis-trans isomerase SurA